MSEEFPVLSGKKIFERIKQSLEPGKRIKDLLKDLNFQKSTIYRWDEKDTVPRTQEILRIAEYLEVPLYWLLTGVDEKGLSEDERKLLKDFENLNDQGRMLAIEHVEGLLRHFPQKRTSKKSTTG